MAAIKIEGLENEAVIKKGMNEGFHYPQYFSTYYRVCSS